MNCCALTFYLSENLIISFTITVKMRRYEHDQRIAGSCLFYLSVRLVIHKPYTVKMRRYKQDKENAALLQGVYLGVHDQNKTQVRRSIAPYIRIYKLNTEKIKGE